MKGLMRRVRKVEEEMERQRPVVVPRLLWVDPETGRTVDAITGEELPGRYEIGAGRELVRLG